MCIENVAHGDPPKSLNGDERWTLAKSVSYLNP